MLDYKKLSDEFTVKLSQFDEDRLEKWLSFDQSRQTCENLFNGEEVIIQTANIPVSKLSDPRELINSAGESNYSLAA